MILSYLSDGGGYLFKFRSRVARAKPWCLDAVGAALRKGNCLHPIAERRRGVVVHEHLGFAVAWVVVGLVLNAIC